MPELHYIGISAAFDPTDEGDNPACSKCNDRLAGEISCFLTGSAHWDATDVATGLTMERW